MTTERNSLEAVVPQAPAPAFVSPTLEALLREVGEDDEDIFANRVEWKYVLDYATAAALREAVAAKLRLEEFIPGRKKTVMHSIYFDSEDFMLYRRQAGASSSMKFRLRTYTTFGDWSKMDPQGFFECKIGRKGKKYKLRAMVPVRGAGDLISPARLGVVGTGRLITTPSERFMLKAKRVLKEFKMIARLTVSYVREAWVSEDGAVRITFDDTYRASRITTGDRSPLKPPGALDVIIAELKFVGSLPPWLQAVMETHGLPIGGVTFSKFRQGVALTYPEIAAQLPEAERAGERHAS